MLKSLFKPRPAQSHADRLYAAAVAQARTPAFYLDLGVEDRIDARFDLYTLHILLLVMRLRDEPGEDGAAVAQDLFDVYVSALDHALRELGVGDISVAKKMRKLAESLYGRMNAWEAPLRDGDAEALGAALARNVYGGEPDARSAHLAAYAMRARVHLAAQSFSDVMRVPVWPEVA